jgi:hypothetical protein
MPEKEVVYYTRTMHRFSFLVTVRNSSSYFLKDDIELYGY